MTDQQDDPSGDHEGRSTSPTEQAAGDSSSPTRDWRDSSESAPDAVDGESGVTGEEGWERRSDRSTIAGNSRPPAGDSTSTVDPRSGWEYHQQSDRDRGHRGDTSAAPADRDATTDDSAHQRDSHPEQSQFDATFHLYSSTGEPVATTASRQLSPDPNIGRYFDDGVQAVIEVDRQNDRVEVTCAVRASATPHGRRNSYFIRFGFDPTDQSETFRTALERFMRDTAGLTLAAPDDAEPSILELLWSASPETPFDGETMSNLGELLDTHHECVELSAPTQQTALETALAFLSETPAQSVAISRRDHHLETAAFDVFVRAGDAAETTLSQTTRSALEEFRAQLEQETVHGHLETISEEIRTLQRETRLDNSEVRHAITAELPATSAWGRIAVRVRRVKQLVTGETGTPPMVTDDHPELEMLSRARSTGTDGSHDTKDERSGWAIAGLLGVLCVFAGLGYVLVADGVQRQLAAGSDWAVTKVQAGAGLVSGMAQAPEIGAGAADWLVILPVVVYLSVLLFLRRRR